MPLPNDIYGQRIGQIPLPSPYQDLQNIIPGLPGLNTAASGAIMNKLKGQLSPETLAMMQNYQAATATRSGMPGSNVIPGSLNYNRSLRDLGRTVEDTQSKGLSELLPFLATTSSTQTVNPALQYERNLQNAINIASPEPAAAGQHAEELFNKYLNLLTNPAGGTRGAGMPAYSYAPKPVASVTRPTTGAAPQRAITGASSFTSGWDGRPSGQNQSLWDTAGFGPFGFSGALPEGTRGTGSSFYAGEGIDPEAGVIPSPWTSFGEPDYSTGEGMEFDPLDYLLGLGLLN